MRTLAWDDPALALRGALAVRAVADGIAPQRLPEWTAAQMPDPALALMAGQAAGVRLALRTDAARIALGFRETGLKLGDEPRRPAFVDVVVDGALHARIATDKGPTLAIDAMAVPPRVEALPGTASEIAIDLPEGFKDVELWLPQTASVELHALRVPEGAAVAPLPPRGRSWLHYGSSISHAMEAAGPSETWPAIAAARLGLELTSLGFAGQCLLDSLVARTLAASDAALISLKLGINLVNHDAMRERVFVPAVHGFLDWIRDRKPDVPILLVSPIFCPLAEDGPGPTLRTATGFRVPERSAALALGALSLRRIRELLSGIVQRRGDANLHYLDGLALFGPADADRLPDLLHPDAEGQRRMGARFAESPAARTWAGDSAAKPS